MSRKPDPRHHWRDLSKEPEHQGGPLRGEAEADCVVIGGGFTGLNAALALAKSGYRTILLEADAIGQAASGRNNGQVIPHHSRASPREIEATFGPVRGAIYNRMVAEAPTRLFETIRHYAIVCDHMAEGWIQACHSAHALSRAKLFHEEWRALGAEVEWLDRSNLADKVGNDVFLGGWKARRAGYLNPYALAQGLARAATAEGADIRQNSPVVAIRRDGASWRVATDRGSVKAPRILVATNITAGGFWPGLEQAVIPVRVYQIATAPLGDNLRSLILPDGEGLSDTSRDIRAFRYDSAGGLAMVGTHTLWFDAARRGKQATLSRLRDILPMLPDAPAAAYWEGTLGVVPDRAPRLMRLAEGILFAGIYSGRGVALSASWGPIAARLLVDSATSEDMPVPVTDLRRIPGHAVGVQVARFAHPFHRLQDRLDPRS